MTDIQAMKRRRQEIKARGSPPFRKRPSIAADDIYLYAPADNSKAARYFPFDYLQIINQSNVDVLVELEQRSDRSWTVGSSAARTLDDIQPFRSYSVTNLDSSTSISQGELTVIARRQPWDANKQAQQQLQADDLDSLLRLGGLLL